MKGEFCVRISASQYKQCLGELKRPLCQVANIRRHRGVQRGVTPPWSPLSKFWDPLRPKISAEGEKKNAIFGDFSTFSKKFLEKKFRNFFFSEIARKSLKFNKKVIFFLKNTPPPWNQNTPPGAENLTPLLSNFWVPPPLTLQTVPTYGRQPLAILTLSEVIVSNDTCRIYIFMACPSIISNCIVDLWCMVVSGLSQLPFPQ